MDLIYKIANIIKKFTLPGKVSLLFISAVILIAVFAPYFSQHPPDKSSGPALIPQNGEHILGTDELGYDIWAQICYGSRVTLLVGLSTALLSALGGGIIGIFAGYSGGVIDSLIMRLVDLMLIIPGLPVMIVLAAFFGPSLLNIILVISLFSWVIPARIVRSQVLMLKEMKYIKSAETYGAGAWYLIRKHFLPELFPLIAVNIIRLSGRAIIMEAGLSFLGLGDPTSKSWGLIIHHAVNFSGIYFTPFWKWWLLYPWLALSLLIASLAFINRELEDVYSLRR